VSTSLKKPKNKGGRPPRAPGEKLQRVNLSLKPKLLFGLEVVARDRRTSLSQAAEYLIEQQLRAYNVDGEPASRLLENVAGIMQSFVAKGDPVSKMDGADVEQISSRLLGTNAGRAFFMPQSLQQPIERYFRSFYTELMRNARSYVKEELSASAIPVLTLMSTLLRPDLMDRLYEIASDAERKGIAPTECAADTFQSLTELIDALPDG